MNLLYFLAQLLVLIMGVMAGVRGSLAVTGSWTLTGWRARVIGWSFVVAAAWSLSWPGLLFAPDFEPQTTTVQALAPALGPYLLALIVTAAVLVWIRRELLRWLGGGLALIAVVLGFAFLSGHTDKPAAVTKVPQQTPPFVGTPATPQQARGTGTTAQGEATVAHDRWGYIDTTGKMVIAPQFATASGFSEGLAAIQPEKGGKWGYIDTTGKLVITLQFESAGSFSDGLARIQTGGKRGFIDRTGKVVIAPQFAGAYPFSEGLAAILPDKGGKWGYIDRTGKMVIPPQFVSAYPFSDGLAKVRMYAVGMYEGYGYIDKTGKFVIPTLPPQITYADSFVNGRAAIQTGGRSGYIDKTGEMVIPPLFRNGWLPFSEEMAPVLIETVGGWSYIDTAGKIVIPPQPGNAWHPFSEGLAQIQTGSKQGYINKTGKVVIPPLFERAERFSGGLALIQTEKGGKWGYIDKTGKVVIPPQFARAEQFSDGRAAVLPGTQASQAAGIAQAPSPPAVTREPVTPPNVASRTSMAPLDKRLHDAATKGDVNEAAALLKQGAPVNAATDSGWTPLHLAAGNGHEAVVRLLLEKGAAVNAAANDGVTPLHVAAARGHEAVVRLLLDKGAAVNTADINGWTPLRWAASGGKEAVARLLREKGARMDVKDKSGKTPSDVARGKGKVGTVTGTVTYTGKAEEKEFSFLKFPNPKFCAKIGTDGHKPDLVKGDKRIFKTIEVGKGGALNAAVVAVTDIEDSVWMDGYEGTEVETRFCELQPYTGVVVNQQNFYAENVDKDPDDPRPVKGVLHNAHSFERVRGRSTMTTIFNIGLAGKGSTMEKKIKLRKENQGSFVHLLCDQHEWEQAFFLPVKNPHYAVTGTDGRFTIENVPAGKRKLIAWHPFAGQVEADVEVKDGATVTANFRIKK